MMADSFDWCAAAEGTDKVVEMEAAAPAETE